MATTTTERSSAVAEIALDELAHLAPALADERDHVDGGGGGAGDHAEQRGLADAGAGENAKTLPAAAGNEAVQGAHAERDALADAGSVQRCGGSGDRGAQARPLGPATATPPSPSSGAPSPSMTRPSRWEPTGTRKGAPRGEDLRAGADALELAEGHQQRAALAKADDLGGNRLAPTVGSDEAHLTDLGLQTGGLDDQPD